MSPTSAKRPRQVADLLQREVSVILRREINDPRLATLSITSVSVSPELKNASIYFTLLDNAQLAEVKKSLEKAAGFIRHCVAERVALRYTPQLTFIYDETLESAERMTRILQDIPTQDDDDDQSKAPE